LRKDDDSDYFRRWLAAWVCFTASALSEVAYLVHYLPGLRVAETLGRLAALLLFTFAILQHRAEGRTRSWPMLPLLGLVLAGVYYVEWPGAQHFWPIRWQTAVLESVLCLVAGWVGWRKARKGHGFRLLAGAFFLHGLHGFDRALWGLSPIFLLRQAFDHLLGVALGIAAAVEVMERARERTEQLNDKMRRLTLVTAGSTQTSSVREFLDRVLAHLVESLKGTHGIVRLVEGEGATAQLVARSWVGFSPSYMALNQAIPVSDGGAQRI